MKQSEIFYGNIPEKKNKKKPLFWLRIAFTDIAQFELNCDIIIQVFRKNGSDFLNNTENWTSD